MVANGDQNKVFDTGDPSGHAAPPPPSSNGGAGGAPSDDLVKLQNMLLSKRREEIFKKKKKKKLKKNKLEKEPELPQLVNHTASQEGLNNPPLPLPPSNGGAVGGQPPAGGLDSGGPESSGVPSKKFDLEQPRPPRKSNILVTQAVAAALPVPGLEPGPVASVSKTLPSEHVQTCQPRPPKRLFKATRRLSFEQDDQKPTPVGNAKAKKCLLCPNLTNAKKMEIRLHLNEIHKIAKAKTCKICLLIFKSQADLQGHGCPLEASVKSPKSTI